MTSTMSMRGRRTHRKSRHGCQQCKARKIKCDEVKPTCRNCSKHAVDCTYSLPSGGSPLAQGQETSPQASNLSSCGPSDLAVHDLELLHHFSTSTAYTFSQHAAIQTFWRIDAPQIGFAAHYTLRAMLAISALHMAYLRPAQRQLYVSQAEAHHSVALKFVTSNMTQLINENSSAVFLFSILTSFFSCAKPRKLEDLLLFQQGRISEWLLLFRGTGTIVEYAQEELRSGPLAALLNIRQRRSDYRSTLSTQGQPFMNDLEELVREEVKDQQELQIYLGAIQEMRVSYALWSDTGVWETGDVFVWLLLVSEEFLMFLREQRYVALVIFGYFCPLLRRLEWMWWLEGWSVHLLSRIHGLLDKEHRTWIQWPMEQLGWRP
ncbi:hypothetical protein Aspvir_009275 [Aspergillus viridinutans]|uniref:Zn(2)-C6 fungal-type domain-containing protein n=1 Tax=Aspergillus viridinutans TaxID=75553 RepID=A0A9P3F4E9_ASPVI|nr:uncharacterized protein Aspvir_009275 [Aspergillus viridinutans]GIK05172.1 hypothetical protein Aspvir_009275 [Aspergillus viridinutans]